MIQLLDKADLSPIARIALTSYIQEKPKGMRVSRKSYDDWRSSAGDPLLPSYHSLEVTQPNVGSLFDELADESSRAYRETAVFTLAQSVKRFHEVTGSTRIRDYNEWRKFRLAEYGESHPSPSLDTRGIRWGDVLETAGIHIEGDGRKRKPDMERTLFSLAYFIEQNTRLSSSAYMTWRDRINSARSNKSQRPISLTALLNTLGPSWGEALLSMGVDHDLRGRINKGEVRVEFHLEGGQLVPSPSGGYKFDVLRIK